jgi:hypothetical protein
VSVTLDPSVQPGERTRTGRAFAAVLRAGSSPLRACLPAVVALVTWRLSLEHVDIAHLGSYGLPPALPIAWYLALGVGVIGAVTAITAQRSRGPVIALYLLTVAIILFATVPVLSGAPHYAWVYKHIGVVRYLETHGKVDPNIDIYNRWPGFFALAAALSKIAGRANPETYAGWAELFFVLLDAALIATVVRAVARSTRVAGGAVLLFLVTNWVGQSYYSPQAFSYVLALALLAVMLRHLTGGRARHARRLNRWLERIGRVRQLPVPAETSARWPRGAAVGVVLALDAVIVASHQLTPYILLGSVALLMLAGVVRPWWALAVMAAMTFAYLGANFGYVQHHYGLVNSIDPFNNVQKVAAYKQTPASGKAFNATVEQLSAAVLYLTGLGASLYLLRRGLLGQALPFLLLAIAPFFIAFGQNYGGEAPLRIVLFSCPWWSALIAWAASTVRRRARRWLAMGAFAVLFSALFVPSFFGQEELNLISPGEVQASELFYSRARPGAVLVLASPGFPLKYGGSYPDFEVPEAEGAAYPAPPLVNARAFRGQQLGPAEVPRIVAIIRHFPHYAYLAFSRKETAYAETFGLTPPGALADLESAVASSPYFRLWYGNQDARIYEYIPLASPPVARKRSLACRLRFRGMQDARCAASTGGSRGRRRAAKERRRGR